MPHRVADYFAQAERWADNRPEVAQTYALLAVATVLQDVGASVDDVSEELKLLRTDVESNLSHIADRTQDIVSGLYEIKREIPS